MGRGRKTKREEGEGEGKSGGGKKGGECKTLPKLPQPYTWLNISVLHALRNDNRSLGPRLSNFQVVLHSLEDSCLRSLKFLSLILAPLPQMFDGSRSKWFPDIVAFHHISKWRTLWSMISWLKRSPRCNFQQPQLSRELHFSPWDHQTLLFCHTFP